MLPRTRPTHTGAQGEVSYHATIPGANVTAGDMIRWRVRVSRGAAAAARGSECCV
jgi:hypothetical protein